MISRNKKYKFNNKTIRYEPVVIPFYKRFFRFLKFFSINTLIAGVFTFLIYIFWGSPIEIALGTKINLLKKEYLTINNNIDSLENTLHSKIVPVDIYYREILDLDSLPKNIRYAGSGGSEPITDLTTTITDELILETSKKINTLQKQVQIQNESFLKIFNTAVKYRKELSDVPAIQPIMPAKNTWISSDFGARQDPFTFLRSIHKGIDFVGPKNTKIYATANGIVTLAKDSRRGYGNEVVISHSFGYSTRYAHMNEILVKEGQKVKRGQIIGLMGNTGRSTGTHLHYEVRLNKRPINPIYYFADDLTEKEYKLIIKQNTDGN